MLLPAAFNDGHMSGPVTYYDNNGPNYDDHGSPTFLAPTFHPPNSYGVTQDLTTEFESSHAAPRWRNDLPISGAYSFELSPGVQNGNSRGNSSLSSSPGDGPSRHRVVGSSFSNTLLNFPPAELGPHYEQPKLHRTPLGSGVSARGDAGPSRSGLITSVSSCGT